MTAPAAQASSVEQSLAGWGSNNYGQLGDGTKSTSTTVVASRAAGPMAGKTVVNVSAGLTHSCAITEDSAVLCWGRNQHGQLGNGSFVDSVDAVAVVSSGVLAGKSVSQVTAGFYHSCALTTTGEVFCWGLNSSGQLGNNSFTNSSVPVAVTGGALAGKTVVEIVASDENTCALTAEGTVACWGGNGFGQLGTGGGVGLPATTPVAVQTSGALSGRTVSRISSTAGSAVCALTTDGRAFCWGRNSYGNLGDNSNIHRNAPVAVNTSGALAGKVLDDIAVGRYHTCAKSTDNLLFCWGWGQYGQLGRNLTTNSFVPVPVTMTGALAGKTVKEIRAGGYHTCALTTDNSLSCWGINGEGQLGDNSTTTRLVPVSAPEVPGSFGAARPIVAFSAGSGHTMAIYGYSVRPGSPAGLAVSGDVGARVLSWQAPNFAGGSSVTEYWVFYRPSGESRWKAFARGVTSTEMPLSANATQPGPCTGASVCPRRYGSLQVGTSYDFQLVAVNSYGNGRWSNMTTVSWQG